MNPLEIEVYSLSHGVLLGETHPALQASIAATPDAIEMSLAPGERLEEHKHGNSMYFTRNVRLVSVEGHDYDIGYETAWVFIPEGVPHGWADTIEASLGTVHSYHPDHDDPSVVRL